MHWPGNWVTLKTFEILKKTEILKMQLNEIVNFSWVRHAHTHNTTKKVFYRRKNQPHLWLEFMHPLRIVINTGGPKRMNTCFALHITCFMHQVQMRNSWHLNSSSYNYLNLNHTIGTINPYLIWGSDWWIFIYLQKIVLTSDDILLHFINLNSRNLFDSPSHYLPRPDLYWFIGTEEIQWYH